jgi:hypothetical protein
VASSPADRRAAASDLRGLGWSLRRIAGALGTSAETIRADLATTGSTAPGGRVEGRDGRSYPAAIARRDRQVSTPGTLDQEGLTRPPGRPSRRRGRHRRRERDRAGWNVAVPGPSGPTGAPEAPDRDRGAVEPGARPAWPRVDRPSIGQSVAARLGQGLPPATVEGADVEAPAADVEDLAAWPLCPACHRRHPTPGEPRPPMMARPLLARPDDSPAIRRDQAGPPGWGRRRGEGCG